MSETYTLSFNIKAMDFSAAGEASSTIKKVLMHLGMPPSVIKRAAVCSYESEMNIVIHSYGGTLTLSIDSSQVIINAIDIGPGIPDIEKAMEAGYSTAPEEIKEMGFGGGMGLPNIRDNADILEITSSSAGTNVKIVINIGG
ncbi:MAG: anti-sigma regulatory factor [Thermoanaerobacteraceae bacterium]|nr:anti-sigma regulatory factor [Thermoanaerobacteraceae bacterium]